MAPDAARLQTTPPADRPALHELAVEAAGVLRRAVANLSPNQRVFLSETPLDAAVAMAGRYTRRLPSAVLSPEMPALELKLLAQGGPAWVSEYRRLVLLHLLVSIPRRTPGWNIPELA